jgi:hypothetical protein
MPGELLSAILGNMIARIVSKLAPPRRAGEFAGMSFETLEQRNRWLYRCIWGVACFGFSAPIFALAAHWRVGNESDPWRGAWFAGVVFGLPFALMFAFLVVLWGARGSRRTRELLFYFERKQQTHIYVFYAFGVPLSVLGVISSLFLWW